MAPTDIACNNCASSSPSADQISAKWKGKKSKSKILYQYGQSLSGINIETMTMNNTLPETF
jgi:hypothetical protein